MALSPLARQRAAALQRGFGVLGLKPLGDRLHVSERQARRIADGSRGTSAENERRINRLWRDYGDRVQAVARQAPAGTRERVDRSTGEIVRTVGRRRLPDVVASPAEVIASVGDQRAAVEGDDMGDLAAGALAHSLGDTEGEHVVIVIDTAGDDLREPPAVVGFGFPRGLPARVDQVVGFFVVREYRFGRTEYFTLRSVLPPGAPVFERAARGLPRERDGTVLLKTDGAARRFGNVLATEWREAMSSFAGGDVILGPSYLRAGVPLAELFGEA